MFENSWNFAIFTVALGFCATLGHYLFKIMVSLFAFMIEIIKLTPIF